MRRRAAHFDRAAPAGRRISPIHVLHLERPALVMAHLPAAPGSTSYIFGQIAANVGQNQTGLFVKPLEASLTRTPSENQKVIADLNFGLQQANSTAAVVRAGTQLLQAQNEAFAYAQQMPLMREAITFQVNRNVAMFNAYKKLIEDDDDMTVKELQLALKFQGMTEAQKRRVTHGDHGVFTAGGAGGSRAATLHGSGAGFGAFANGETTIDPITGKITKKWQHDKLTATKDSG